MIFMFADVGTLAGVAGHHALLDDDSEGFGSGIFSFWFHTVGVPIKAVGEGFVQPAKNVIAHSWGQHPCRLKPPKVDNVDLLLALISILIPGRRCERTYTGKHGEAEYHHC